MQDKNIPRAGYYLSIVFIVLFSLWYGFFLFKKVDLTRADLGRHIKNGEIVLKNFAPQVFGSGGGGLSILRNNYYSYTHPAYAVVNHHWGAGVLFYLVNAAAGIGGLTLLYGVLSIYAFILLYRIAEKESNAVLSAALSAMLIPVIAERTEIRPEVFSYFFSAVFLYILWRYKENNIDKKYLFLLPLLQLFWVNLHIYFIFGIFLTGVFAAGEVLRERSFSGPKARLLGFVLLLLLAASLINPFGIRGLTYPFGIFGNYGYKIVENQSVTFVENYGLINPNYGLFKISFFTLLATYFILFVFNIRRFSYELFAIGITFGVMGWLAIRNFTIFGLFALPVMSYNLGNAIGVKKLNDKYVKAVMLAVLAVFFIYNSGQRYLFTAARWSYFGFGCMPENGMSAQFFIEQNIKGPVFNNYDIGGYLIYRIFPGNPVFVDNRPEAYPAQFFKEVYVPMQQDNSIWEKVDKEYGFNAIYFSHLDVTPWGQNFLIERVNDPAWAPVFADNYAIIFVKRNENNKKLIGEFEVPKDRFRVVRNNR